uniref:Ras modification protein ERF4 n=1 Tax=Bursaphelenchus xylophilus TaxID=6326 RepID=A0A1I7RPJ1_BURXY
MSSQPIALDNCHKIFVERDYSSGLDVRFQRSFPSTLDGVIDENSWFYMIDNINSMFKKAESVNMGAIGETLVSFFTCYLVRLCTTTRYEKQLQMIRKFINEQNKNIFLPAGLCITDPIERGLRVLEITVLSSGGGVQSPTRDLHLNHR